MQNNNSTFRKELSFWSIQKKRKTPIPPAVQGTLTKEEMRQHGCPTQIQ